MKKHEKFLEFSGHKIYFVKINDIYWIALKPICEALKLNADSYIKKTKRDAFFRTCLDTMSIQVSKNDKNQGRNMVCLPEEFIYGWICILNSDDEYLIEYKKTCYRLIYNHFHGTITNRKELLIERIDVDTEIHNIKKELKESDEQYKRLEFLQTKKKILNNQLNSIDKELIKQPEFF